MNNTHLMASAGNVLTNGEMFLNEIWLCSANFIKDWYEISIEEAKERWPEEFVVDETEALQPEELTIEDIEVLENE